jgi:hypothetical protein
MATRVALADASESEVKLSFEELKKLGVHDSYIQFILKSAHDQDKRFKQYLAHVLEAPAARPNKENLIYSILRVFPREYLRSVVNADDEVALALNFRREEVGGSVRSEPRFNTDHHVVSLSTDGNNSAREEQQVFFL